MNALAIGSGDTARLSLVKPETKPLKAPFPYYGGKSRAAAEIWRRFGNVRAYVEPFCGSTAVLLARPDVPPHAHETINDAHGFVTNFWRAVRADPKAVGRYADYPVSEADLTARHVWLVNQSETLKKLFTDPHWYDPKVAGWWVWGQCQWIGAGWCTPKGRTRKAPSTHEKGFLCRTVNHNIGGIFRQPPRADGSPLTCGEFLTSLFDALQARLARVAILCGDWSRVVTTGRTVRHGVPCGVLLDPPYPTVCDKRLYSDTNPRIAEDVRGWALEHGDDPSYRIALCGLEGEHNMPARWSVYSWRSQTGRESRLKERIWFSPHCLSQGEPVSSPSKVAVFTIYRGAQAMAKRGQKSEKIREVAMKLGPDAKPKEVMQALKEQGVSVKQGLVYNVMSTLRSASSSTGAKGRGRGRGRRATAGAGSGDTAASYLALVQLTRELGKDNVKRFVDGLE